VENGLNVFTPNRLHFGCRRRRPPRDGNRSFARGVSASNNSLSVGRADWRNRRHSAIGGCFRPAFGHDLRPLEETDFEKLAESSLSVLHGPDLPGANSTVD